MYVFLQLLKLTNQEASEDPMYYLLLRDSIKYVFFHFCFDLFSLFLVQLHYNISLIIDISLISGNNDP